MATWEQISADFPEFVEWVAVQYGADAVQMNGEEVDTAKLTQYKFAYDIYVDRGSSDIVINPDPVVPEPEPVEPEPESGV